MDLPRPPEDPEIKNIIDKLATFVARNGPEFEQMTKNKQENNPKFSFLFGGQYYDYYGYKVSIEQQLLRSKGYDGPGQNNGGQGGNWNQGQGNWGSGTPPRPLMSGGWGGQGGPSQGSPWNSPGPGMGRGMGPGHGHRPNSPHFGGGYPGHNNGNSDLPNRGRSILGAPPGLMDQPVPPPPGLLSHPPHPQQPVGPNVNHLELQAAEIQQTIKNLQEQIVQSETNLTAQWTVMQQTQKTQVSVKCGRCQNDLYEGCIIYQGNKIIGSSCPPPTKNYLFRFRNYTIFELLSFYIL